VSSENASSDFVSTTGVAGRYAAALFDLASDEGQADAVEGELKALRAAINESDDLRAFLKSPVYTQEDQLAAVSALADKAGYSVMTSNFLKLVATNRRLFALDAVINAFLAHAAAARGEVSAQAVSAAPMNDEQVKSLRLEIESMVGKAVNLELKVDPDLLGGLIVKVGSQMIDSSLRTKLNKLKTVMKEA
jgi:F-type H+-transporting ATPase subunit delta